MPTEATDAIIERALISVLETKPFEKITIDDIARAAEIDRSTFYRYFHSKYEALSSSFPVLINAEMFQQLDAMHPSSRLETVVNWVAEHRRLMKNLLIENQQYSSFTELVRVVSSILNDFNDSAPENYKSSPLVLLVTEAPNRKRIIRLAATMLVSVLTDYISHDASMTADDVMIDIRYLFHRLGLEDETSEDDNAATRTK
ncbi:helix-turn-helix domain containing protein [Lacticaseibacillus pabuli]|uniref:Helix-turn-helix domain containing protein n=1 Tax=Lacticaseibacillus pabuli TaxID=3025672 RepID=A0ABY7WS01_9LACO|nr:TetR/AcrR family transcriptional regulator [Lacticaseibacillus sp. KACC 23028]WDF82968.1 helix-turn-helix domain containing protein [Lacticaseibacillus sp. KACC 23028]